MPQIVEPSPGVYYAVVSQTAEDEAAETGVVVTIIADTCSAGCAGPGFEAPPHHDEDFSHAATNPPSCKACLGTAPLLGGGTNSVERYAIFFLLETVRSV